MTISLKAIQNNVKKEYLNNTVAKSCLYKSKPGENIYIIIGANRHPTIERNIDTNKTIEMKLEIKNRPHPYFDYIYIYYKLVLIQI